MKNEMKQYKIGVLTGLLIGIIMVGLNLTISTQTLDFPVNESLFTVVFMTGIGGVISLIVKK